MPQVTKIAVHTKIASPPNSDDDDDGNDVLVGSDKIVGEMAKRTITFNMMRRMVTLCESHPYVCSMNAKSELRTILWGVLVGSEVFAKIEYMQSAVAEYRTKCEQMGMKLINGSNSNPKKMAFGFLEISLGRWSLGEP